MLGGHRGRDRRGPDAGPRAAGRRRRAAAAALREDLLNLLADVEAGLDFVDEDIEFVGQAELLTRVAAGLAHLTTCAGNSTSRAVSGRPVRVALVGEPNAGKSSLFNALAGGTGCTRQPAGGDDPRLPDAARSTSTASRSN